MESKDVNKFLKKDFWGYMYDGGIHLRLVLATIAVDGYKPILGDKRSKTRWSVFIKS